MRHGGGYDIGMLRLALSRLRSLGLAQHDRVNEASLRGHRCSADAEQDTAEGGCGPRVFF
jgi:hypothetical protein